MGPDSFELDVVGAGDATQVAAVEKLAAHAAGFAGCGADEAGAFAAVVAAVMAQRLEPAGASAAAAPDAVSVRVIVRRHGGPLEVLVACERRFEPRMATDARTSVAWTHEGGALMCRVARELAPGAEPDDLSETAQKS